MQVAPRAPPNLTGRSPGAATPSASNCHIILHWSSCRVVLEVQVTQMSTNNPRGHRHGSCTRPCLIVPRKNTDMLGAHGAMRSINGQWAPEPCFHSIALQSTITHLNFSQAWRTPVPPLIHAGREEPHYEIHCTRKLCLALAWRWPYGAGPQVVGFSWRT